MAYSIMILVKCNKFNQVVLVGQFSTSAKCSLKGCKNVPSLNGNKCSLKLVTNVTLRSRSKEQLFS